MQASSVSPSSSLSRQLQEATPAQGRRKSAEIEEAPKPKRAEPQQELKPSVNSQGQKVGSRINTSA
ncbi:hypothetical protein [Chitinimonas sp.]|uniref:hypothetical protein n=1 Tax=Chitinimonas sp. TaxID=1934313 RepID=UPI0035B40F7E